MPARPRPARQAGLRQNNMKQHETIWSNMKQFGTIWNYIRLSGTKRFLIVAIALITLVTVIQGCNPEPPKPTRWNPCI